MKLKLKEDEGSVPVNNASDGNVAGLDNNPPRRTMGFKIYRRNKNKGYPSCRSKIRKLKS